MIKPVQRWLGEAGCVTWGCFVMAGSFLGIGLQPPTVSWGIDISSAIVGLRTTPHMLFFPSLFLSLAVLAFIMLGDVVRDALDPKNR